MKEDRCLSFWAYAAQLSSIFNLFLLPLLLRAFPPEKVALWYLFLTLGTLGTLAEQSIEPAVTRYLTYARTGVVFLPQYGAPPGPASGEPAIQLMRIVVAAARWLHARTSLLNLGLFSIGGGLYLWHLGAMNDMGLETLRAWTLFSIGQYLTCRLLVNVPILQGLGHTRFSFQAMALQRTLFFLCATVGLFYAPSLEILGYSHVISTGIGLGTAGLKVRRQLAGVQLHLEYDEISSCVRELLRGSTRLWITRFGAFLILKSNLLLVACFLGLQISGRLALSMQAMDTLTLVALTPLFSRLPKLYELQTLGHSLWIKSCVGSVLLMAWITFSVGSVWLVLQGPSLLILMGSRSSLLPMSSLLLLLVTGMLEMNHSFSATLLLLDNRVPFVKASVISGFLIVILSSLVLAHTRMGLIGALAIPFSVQLAYNNWKWPTEALRMLKTNYGELLRLGFTWKP